MANDVKFLRHFVTAHAFAIQRIPEKWTRGHLVITKNGGPGGSVPWHHAGGLPCSFPERTPPQLVGSAAAFISAKGAATASV